MVTSVTSTVSSHTPQPLTTSLISRLHLSRSACVLACMVVGCDGAHGGKEGRGLMREAWQGRVHALRSTRS